MPRKVAYLLFIFFLLCTPMHAQEDFRKQFDDFTRSVTEVYAAFTDSVNLVFAKALGETWEPFELDDAVERILSPLPAVSPSEEDLESGMELPVYETVAPVTASFSAAFETGSFFGFQQEPARELRFSFHGKALAARVPERYGSFHPGGIGEKDVAAFWKELASCDYNPTVEDYRKQRDFYGFNDWAAYEWVRALAAAIYPEDVHSERAVFTVFMLNQMGLMAKVARSSGKLLCLFPSRQQVYARKFIVIDTYPYYLADAAAPASEIFTYKAGFAKATAPMDLRLPGPLSLGGGTTTVKKTSKTFGATLSVPLDRAALSFYGSCPQTDPDVYAAAAPCKAFETSLVGQLRKLLDADAADTPAKLERLLEFVQKDFAYKTDPEQFGYEKPFFCEENFAFPFNDCEDRTVLLSFLARKVLGLRTVLLEYSDHMALAVELPQQPKGDYVRYDGGRFYVCDPSFIGASVGQSMPKYRTTPAKVWAL